MMNVILIRLIKLFNKQLGEDYEYDEIPSLIDSVFQSYVRKYNEHTYDKYINPLRYDGKDVTTLEGQLDKMLDKIYKRKTPYVASSSSNSSKVSFKTNSSYSGSSSSYSPK